MTGWHDDVHLPVSEAGAGESMQNRQKPPTSDHFGKNCLPCCVSRIRTGPVQSAFYDWIRWLDCSLNRNHTQSEVHLLCVTGSMHFSEHEFRMGTGEEERY